jgi:hypothetical protein
MNATAADQDSTIPVWIKVSPDVLALHSQGGRLTVHTDIAYSLVDKDTILLNGILEPYIVKSDARGQLVAGFDIDEVKDMVEPPSATFTFTGETKDGDDFIGTDTIRVID